MTRALLLALALLASPAMAQTASCQGSLDTCGLVVPCAVLRVIDGDSIRVACTPWPGLEIAVTARLRGLDAPEMRARCESERAMAEAARDALAEMAGERVLLLDVEDGKYGGRAVATVITLDGRDLAAEMIARGLAREYDGKSKRRSWCR